MPLAPRTASEEIQLTVHPPERGQRPGPVTAACGCCCCCCCCLHTIGGLIALFCLPAIQLVASLLAVLVAAIFYTDKASALIRVGKITLWCFVGTTVGVLIMFALCGGMGMLGGLFR